MTDWLREIVAHSGSLLFDRPIQVQAAPPRAKAAASDMAPSGAAAAPTATQARMAPSPTTNPPLAEDGHGRNLGAGASEFERERRLEFKQDAVRETEAL